MQGMYVYLPMAIYREEEGTKKQRAFWAGIVRDVLSPGYLCIESGEYTDKANEDPYAIAFTKTCHLISLKDAASYIYFVDPMKWREYIREEDEAWRSEELSPVAVAQ